jgi:hypothetical protein
MIRPNTKNGRTEDFGPAIRMKEGNAETGNYFMITSFPICSPHFDSTCQRYRPVTTA